MQDKHIADDGVMSFPQNKYIISHIRRSAKDQIGDVECCREHRKEASFYCKEVGCQKVICNTCLVKLHKFHDIVDIHEELNEQQELLENKVKTLKVILETKMAVALAAKAKAEESFNCSLRKINSRREEIIELFDQMKNDLTEKQNEVNGEIQREITSIDSNMNYLNERENNHAEPSKIAST